MAVYTEDANGKLVLVVEDINLADKLAKAEEILAAQGKPMTSCLQEVDKLFKEQPQPTDEGV